MEPTSNLSLKENHVNREISTSLTLPRLADRVPAWLRVPGIVLLGTAFLALCAHVSIPLWFTPVPLSLQPFGVLLLALVLSPELALATLAAYLIEGAGGLPVFAPAAPALSGLAHLLGPTGGYLMAYPLAAWLISALARRSSPSFTLALGAAALGDILILACGALWIAATSHISLFSALSLGLVPFLPGDAIKVAAAAGLASGWRRFRS